MGTMQEDFALEMQQADIAKNKLRLIREHDITIVAQVLTNRATAGTVTWDGEGGNPASGDLVFSEDYHYGPMRLHCMADYWGGENRWKFSVSFPKDDDGCTQIPRASQMTNPSPVITVSAGKSPQQIASDISGRIAEDAYTSYCAAATMVMNHNKHKESCEGIAETLVTMYKGRGVEYARHSKTELYVNLSGRSPASVGTVKCGSDYVIFEHLNVTDVQAQKILDILLYKNS